MRQLTHWGRVAHLCVGKLTIIAADNGLAPGRRQAIIWTNAGILSIGPLGTNFSEILIEMYVFSFKKMHLKMSSAKWRPFCLGLNVLKKQHKFHMTWHQCIYAGRFAIMFKLSLNVHNSWMIQINAKRVSALLKLFSAYKLYRLTVSELSIMIFLMLSLIYISTHHNLAKRPRFVCIMICWLCWCSNGWSWVIICLPDGRSVSMYHILTTWVCIHY